MIAPGTTPGPWMRDDFSVSTFARAGQPRKTIATAFPDVSLSARASMERMRANARLIAASPDMIAALDHYADQLCEGWCDQSSNCADFEDCGGCLARRVAGIARGEQQ